MLGCDYQVDFGWRIYNTNKPKSVGESKKLWLITLDKSFQTKDPLTIAPRQKPPRTIEREFAQRDFVRVFVLGLVKIGGPRCVTYFFGGPGMCDKV